MPLRFEHFTVDDGLPEYAVFAILQDHLGFLWLGTGNGLARYDGYEFEAFHPDPDDPYSITVRTIHVLHEDPAGDLWIGSQFKGLDHFDRVTGRFTHYGYDPEDASSLSHNWVQSIHQGSDGDLWIVTGQWENGILDSSLDRLDPETGRVTRYRHDPADPGSLSGNNVRFEGLEATDDGALWVATWWDGLNRFDREAGHFVRYRHDPADPGSLIDDRLRDIEKDGGGRLWIGTLAGLDRYDTATDSFVHYRHDPADPGSLGHDAIEVLLPSRAGGLWIGTLRGLGYYDPAMDAFTHFLPAPDAPASEDNAIFQLFEDRTGLLWLRANRIGFERVYTFDIQTRRFKEYRDRTADPQSLVIGHGVRAFHEDHAGTLWFGSWAGGLNKLDRSTGKFRHLAHPAGRDHAGHVTGISEDSRGRLWVGTGLLQPTPHDSGLHLLDRERGTFTHARFGPDDPLATDVGFVRTVYEDGEGQLWLTGGVALRTFDPERGVEAFHALPEARQSPLDNMVTDALEDSDGRFWVSTNGSGLLRFDRSTGAFTHHYHPRNPDRIPGRFVNVLYEDREGVLWVGMMGGLARFDPDTERFVSYFDPHQSYIINDIHEDRRGRFWLATWPLGLVRFDRATGARTAYTTHDGLPHNSAYAVLEDDGGFLWVSTGRGLSRFDPDREMFRNYDAHDGLGGNAFTPAAGHESKSGELFFGGAHGLNAFFPADVRDNPYPPQVALTGLRVFDEPVAPSERGPLHRHIADAEEVRLTHRQNDVTFEYVGLHFSRPEENQYAYKLDGYEGDWRYVGTQRTAIYPNLPPGDYTFRVKAANYDGVWNEEGASLRLIIVPPWWQQAWFRALAALALLCLAAAGYRWRVHHLKERARELEAEVDVRTCELVAEKEKTEAQARRLAELDEAKSRFFANVSHEFRTPLTLLLSPLDEALDGGYGALPAPMQRQVRVMRRNARRLLRLVNQLLDLSKLESGCLELTPQSGDLVRFLRELVRSFTPLAERRRITLRFQPHAEALVAVFDRDALEKVVSNLLSNALKFTPEGGRVWVTTAADSAEEHGAVEIVVKDTGPGIPPEELERIFDRFQQVDGSATRAHEGTGLGLSLARELVALHGGTLRVASEPGSGSAFVVRLPLGLPEDASDAKRAGTVVGGGTAAGDGAASLEDAVLTVEEPGRDAAERATAGRPTVLVVEDHPDVRALLRDVLQPSYRVLEAANGAVGWEAAQQHRPALVVSDVMMPEMDGFELCRRIKADEILRATPVILLTAKAAETDRIHGLEGGADDYVAKPFSKRELLVRVTNLILSRRRLREQFGREVLVQPAGVIIASEDEALLARVLDMLEQHLGDSTFSVERLADELGMSRRQAYRRVKAVTGETPAELLRRLRLERAAQLLKAHPGTVAEVAYAVGFTSPSHFAAAFRKAFGVVPSAHAADEE